MNRPRTPSRSIAQQRPYQRAADPKSVKNAGSMSRPRNSFWINCAIMTLLNRVFLSARSKDMAVLQEWKKNKRESIFEVLFHGFGNESMPKTE